MLGFRGIIKSTGTVSLARKDGNQHPFALTGLPADGGMKSSWRAERDAQGADLIYSGEASTPVRRVGLNKR